MNLNEKYPRAFFSHFVHMLDMNADGDWTSEVIGDHIGLAIQFEGQEYYEGLLGEVRLIVKNDDLTAFAKVFSEDMERQVTEADLQILIDQIKNYQK